MDSNKTRLLRSPTSPPASPCVPLTSQEGKARVDKLVEQIDSIAVSDGTNFQGDQELYQRWFQEACTDNDTLRYAVDRIHHYWLSSRSAVIKAAAVLCTNYMFEIDEVRLRQELLACLQKDFEKRHEIQTKSSEKYLNAAAFLVEFYKRVRIENLPLAFMLNPVFQYLEELLDGDDSEIELFTQLVVGVGPTLVKAQAEDSKHNSLATFAPLQNLFCKVRSILMSRNLSSQSRLWLLFILDVSSSGEFNLPSSTLQEFYKNKDHLGTSADKLLRSVELCSTSSSNQIPDCTQLQLDTIVSEKVAKIKISPKSKVEITAEKVENFGPKRVVSKNEPMDRRENFRSAFQVDTKVNKGKSYWLHDDRFEKEDVESRERGAEKFSKPRASQGNWKRTSNQEEKNNRPMNDNWRQPDATRTRRDHRGPAPNKPSDVLSQAGHSLDETWEVSREEVDHKPRPTDNWRQPEVSRVPKDNKEGGQKIEATDLLALAGHKCEETW